MPNRRFQGRSAVGQYWIPRSVGVVAQSPSGQLLGTVERVEVVDLASGVVLYLSRSRRLLSASPAGIPATDVLEVDPWNKVLITDIGSNRRTVHPEAPGQELDLGEASSGSVRASRWRSFAATAAVLAQLRQRATPVLLTLVAFVERGATGAGHLARQAERRLKRAAPPTGRTALIAGAVTVTIGRAALRLTAGIALRVTIGYALLLIASAMLLRALARQVRRHAPPFAHRVQATAHRTFSSGRRRGRQLLDFCTRT